MSDRPLLAAAITMACLSLPAIATAADAPLPAQAIATADKLRDAGMAGNATDGSRAYDIVESLTTEIGQRLAGTPPAERAVDWARAKFKALGYDKIYTEPVTFPLWTRGTEEGNAVAPWAQLAQDGTDYFDWHHTANDTLDKIGPKALDQQAAAYAVLAYLAAEADGSMGSGEMPLPKKEP